MVIRFTRATRFLLICILLLITALISIGTKSMSVSAPYAAPIALPVIVYRGIENGEPAALRLQELQHDLDFIQERFNALSEQDVVCTLRREKALTRTPVLLIFDDTAENFANEILPLLDENEIPWFSAAKRATLVNELRSAGFPVAQLERTGGVALRDQINAIKS